MDVNDPGSTLEQQMRITLTASDGDVTVNLKSSPFYPKLSTFTQ